MKKTVARLLPMMLGWILVFGFVFPARAGMVVSTTFESQEVDPAQAVQSLAAVGGAVYTLNALGKIGRYVPATRESSPVGACVMTQYMADDQAVAKALEVAGEGMIPLSWLFSDTDTLYGLCIATGQWYALLGEDGSYAPVMQEPKLDTRSLGRSQGAEYSSVSVNGLFARDGYLYYTALSYESGISYRAGRINLDTGEDQPFSTPFINQMIPWKDGALLCLVFDQMNALNSSTGEMESPQYGILDPQKDAFTALGQLPKGESTFGGFVSGLCGDPAQDMLYYSTGGRVMGLNLTTGETHISAYSGEGMLGGFSTDAQAQWVDGYYVKKTQDGLVRYELDSEAMAAGALRIFGEMGGEAHKSFLANYPDIPVDVATDYTIKLEDLTSAMVSGSDAYDVMLLNMSYMPVRQLIEKGYAMDLSGYPEIMEAASRLDTKFVAPLQKDGKVYGVPVDMTSVSLTLNQERWTELGLSKEDAPSSYEELFDFFANWEADYMDDFPDMKLLDIEPYKLVLFSVMLNDYLSYLQAGSLPLSFDTPAFRRAMTAFEAIDFSAFGQDTGPVAQAEVSYGGEESLFRYESAVGQLSRPMDNPALLLSFGTGEKPVVGVNTSVLIINPKTTRLEQAKLYVANYLKNLPRTGARIVLFPENNEPVESKTYASDKKSIQQELEKQSKLLESAEESAKAEVRERITQLELTLENLEAHRFIVTAQAIEEYREQQEPYLWVNRQSVLYTSDTSEVNNLMLQYLDKAITLDQMIQGMDQRVRMMELEAQ